MGVPLEAEAEELFFTSPTRFNPNCPLLRGGATKREGCDCAPTYSRKQRWSQQWEWCFLALLSWVFSCVTRFSGTCYSLMPWCKQEKNKSLTLAKQSTPKWGNARIKVSFTNRVHEHKHDAHPSIYTYVCLYIFIHNNISFFTSSPSYRLM